MAVTNVADSDTFDQWRVKTNTISTNLGDASTLTTVATNVVGGINEVNSNVGNLASLTVSDSSLVDAANDILDQVYKLSLALG